MGNADVNANEAKRLSRWRPPHMGRGYCGRSLIVLLLALLPLPAVFAQFATSVPSVPPVATTAGIHLTPTRIPSTLLRQFIALGDRLTEPGNERITLSGTLRTSTGASPVQVVMELGGKLNVTWAGAASQKVVFDGTSASVTASIPNTDGLLESFVDDLAETLMMAVSRGASPRLLGQGFKNPAGGFCDYYDVATLGQATKQAQPLIKRYCFDSGTSLLSSVRYKRGGSQVTVTEFGGWGSVNRQAVPGTIVRTVGGNQVFHFQAQNSSVSASISDNTFKP